jgi:hypothetical protein
MGNFAKFALFVFIGLLTSGCSTMSSVSLSKDDKAAIGDVAVVWDGYLPGTPFYNGPENQAGAVFGVVGSLVAASSTRSDKEKIADFVKTNDIKLGDIVKSEFESQLSKKKDYNNRIKDGASSKFIIRIPLYGVSAGSFSSEFKPYLVVDAKLVNASGRVIWEQKDYVASHGSAPAATFDAFLGSPEAFTTEFKAAAKEVVGLLLTNLN